MTDEEVDPEMTLTFRGKTIAFCCDVCIEKFKANPDRYLPRLPQFASAAAAGPTAEEDSPLPGGGGEDRAEPSAGPAAEERAPLWGRLHPAMVHFPLAGIPLALVGFLLWVARRRESFAKADIAPLLVGTIAAVLAVNSGNTLEDATRFSASMQAIADRHEWYSERVMVLAMALCLLRIWRWNRMSGRWRWVYGVGLLLACGMLGYTGFLGGSLVFGPNHLDW